MPAQPSITFWGAARAVTGSRHLLHFNGENVLLDCGLVQGRRAEADALNRQLSFDAREIHAVVLSHAHMDHSGNLPSLARHGFAGPIYCTPATASLLEIMLRDSAHIQARDAEFLNKSRRDGEPPVKPLYDLRDVERALGQVQGKRYRKAFTVSHGLSCIFRDAGHILGSATVSLELQRKGQEPLTVVFSGDLGRRNLPILRDPERVPAADVLVIESTYGDRFHEDIRASEAHLGEIVARTVARGGKVIVPAFSVGRSQELIYELNELIKAGKLPEIPIFIDSPLTAKASQIFSEHRECFDEETWQLIRAGDDPFGFERMHYIENVEESKQLNQMHKPCVIISASGMAEAGRILHHLANNIEDERNTVLIVGFQAVNTLGRRLEEGARQVRILGSSYSVRAEVASLHAFSAHADRKDLLEFVAQMDRKPAKTFVVHGEEKQSQALAEGLRAMGLADVKIPAHGETHALE
jgi:metallo-beta-lactamase family protein